MPIDPPRKNSDFVDENTLRPDGVPWARPVVAGLDSAHLRQSDAMLLTGVTRRSVGKDILIAILLLIGFSILGEIIVATVVQTMETVRAPDQVLDRSTLVKKCVIPSLVLRGIISVCIIWLLLRYRRQSAASVGVARRGFWMNVLIGAGATGVVYAIILPASVAAAMFWPEMMNEMEKNARGLMEILPRLSPLPSMGVAMTIGIYEELIFRGFLMTRLRLITGSWALSVVLSTAIFVSLHAADQVPIALMLIGLLSIVFSLVTVWRKSIIPAIVGHFLFDWSQFLWLYDQAGDSWT